MKIKKLYSKFLYLRFLGGGGEEEEEEGKVKVKVKRGEITSSLYQNTLTLL